MAIVAARVVTCLHRLRPDNWWLGGLSDKHPDREAAIAGAQTAPIHKAWHYGRTLTCVRACHDARNLLQNSIGVYGKSCRRYEPAKLHLLAIAYREETTCGNRCEEATVWDECDFSIASAGLRAQNVGLLRPPEAWNTTQTDAPRLLAKTNKHRKGDR